MKVNLFLLLIFSTTLNLYSQSVNFIPSEIWANGNEQSISVSTEIIFPGLPSGQFIFNGGTGYGEWYWTDISKRSIWTAAQSKFNITITLAENNTPMNRSSVLNFELMCDGGPKYYQYNIHQSYNSTTQNTLASANESSAYFNYVTNEIIFSNTQNRNKQGCLLIMDVSGLLVQKEMINPADDNFKIKVVNLPNGVYIYKYNNIIGKFMIN